MTTIEPVHCFTPRTLPATHCSSVELRSRQSQKEGSIRRGMLKACIQVPADALSGPTNHGHASLSVDFADGRLNNLVETLLLIGTIFFSSSSFVEIVRTYVVWIRRGRAYFCRSRMWVPGARARYCQDYVLHFCSTIIFNRTFLEANHDTYVRTYVVCRITATEQRIFRSLPVVCG